MPAHVPPFATYVPGADSHLNASRIQSVPYAVLHRTQGNDSRALGKNRLHSSPGTFNFLIRQGMLYCYYPANVRCSHAAGANGGPGVEIEGFTGIPVADADLELVGQLSHWLHTSYGVPLFFYDGPRRPTSGFRGFITHRSVATEPQWQHHDYITAQEWADAIGDSMPLTFEDGIAIAKIVQNEVDPVEAKIDALTKKVDALSALAGVPQTSVVDLLKRMFPRRAVR